VRTDASARAAATTGRRERAGSFACMPDIMSQATDYKEYTDLKDIRLRVVRDPSLRIRVIRVISGPSFRLRVIRVIRGLESVA
jgi:hypothetical protein